MQFYRRIENDLRRFAASIARHQQEADDLIQSAWEKALYVQDIETWPYYKQKAWFYRVMKNQLIDLKRKQAKESSYTDERDEPVFIVSGYSAIEMIELLESLTPTQSSIVFKRYWVGLSSQEIGEQLQIPASTVRYQLANAIQTLRSLLKEELK
ncbi:RNA polymerase ECF-type sigma factor [Bacillus sp. JCM 19046]|uniref:RNA polymerase sigma-70 factor (ECF subfamily) n=1 Tax=Shouchella xiaoxiensis TaxID=766895 RepID=A0ABS2SWY8_9BACI|nr:RNA polymerase sigma factor [Shouchella xiaoxiensis]MBM7838752.1 RNA polymerase sigma-70 factor (ECF subfamily) [Shouchella xiaoxiensis]GAF11907.1 RNA polymerase ECF-type sigma factor [Bacillus sp. JCM 19045]GAF16203.1 RNA polymerase ECF-type sigma factor [Bacillus sp. JCM 19046]